MKRFFLSFAIALVAVLAASAAERSYSIVFGASSSDTNSLTNDNFVEKAVKEGAGFIENVTSVVRVFPETDGIKMSSSSKNGKCNIELAKSAQVVATRIVVSARRFDNDRDAEANIMLNSETLEVPALDWADYTLAIPSRPEKTLTNLIVDAEHRLYIESITVYYDDRQGTVDPVLETVAAPEFSPAGGSVSAGTAVEISSATPGASIYYTVDGAAPSTAATFYTEPVVIEQDLTLKAFAVKDGMNPSPAAEAVYTVRNAPASLVATFDFTKPASLNPAVDEPAQKESVDLAGRSFSDGDVIVSFTPAEGGNTHVRLYHSYDAGIDLRLYDGDAMTVRTSNPSLSIRSISFSMSLSGAATGSNDINFIPSAGEYTWDTETWLPDEGDNVQFVELTSAMQSRIATMTVTLDRTTGMTGLRPDHDHSAVYYTITGRRVSAATLAPGLYIRIRDNKAEKVYVRSK